MTSSSTARAAGNSARERTHRPVSTSPPAATIASIIASAIRALPPSTTGQPNACASVPNISPTAAVGGTVSGIIACAEIPAMSARASGVWNRRATADAPRSPWRAKAATVTGWRGGVRIDDSSPSLRASACAVSGPNSRW